MIDAVLLQQIADCYDSNKEDPAVWSTLRNRFPQVRFTHSNDDDIGCAKPVLACNGFNLYLVAGEHCLTLTSSFDGAKGIVIADMVDDE